jgi:hypothetical protein
MSTGIDAGLLCDNDRKTSEARPTTKKTETQIKKVYFESLFLTESRDNIFGRGEFLAANGRRSEVVPILREKLCNSAIEFPSKGKDRLARTGPLWTLVVNTEI